jgi:transcriptional regulator with XRE-family HTH domain
VERREFKYILKEVREYRNISQKELASFLSMTSQTISNYENGFSEPSLDTVIEIADFFDISLGYLLGRTRKEQNPYLANTFVESDILDLINFLLKVESRENQEVILKII